MSFDKGGLDSYVDVAARIVEFRGKYPDGSLQPANLAEPFKVVTIGSDVFVVVVAAAYRNPDDVRPGIGMAYEPYPGKTPYTRASELQNAETAAWGRAIVAALAADTKRGVASADEVRNRQADRDANGPDKQQNGAYLVLTNRINGATDDAGVESAWEAVKAAVGTGGITRDQGNQLHTRYNTRKLEVAK